MELRSFFLVLPREFTRPSRGPHAFRLRAPAAHCLADRRVLILLILLILLIPRLLNYIVAIYLIMVGLIGLGVAS